MVTFTGCYAPVEIGQGGDNTILYFGAGNTLYYPNAAMTIGCQRSYFKLNNGIEAGDPTNGVRQFVLNFGEDETTMGIKDITMPSSGSQPPVWQGASGYTVGGFKLNGKPTQKGIYINNGNKIVIK